MLFYIKYYISKVGQHFGLQHKRSLKFLYYWAWAVWEKQLLRPSHSLDSTWQIYWLAVVSKLTSHFRTENILWIGLV